MELRHLRYFVAIAEHRGYREAARRLHVTQPALTQAVLDLEREAGVTFLDRTVRPLALTRAGEAFLHEARSALMASEQALKMARRAARGAFGSLRLAFIPGSTHHFLPDLLKSFKEAHPDIELQVLELTPSAQSAALVEDEIDIAFTRELDEHQRLKFTSLFLFEVPLIAITPATFLCETSRLDVSQLADKELVLLPREESPVLHNAILALCREAGFAPRVKSYPYLAESMMTLVEAEQGVAVLPLWAKSFVRGDLRYALLTPDTVRAELVAACRADHHTEAMDSFLSMLHDRLSLIRRLTDQMSFL